VSRSCEGQILTTTTFNTSLSPLSFPRLLQLLLCPHAIFS